jgi:hypothetical protein
MKRFLRALAIFTARTRWFAPPDSLEPDARALATFLATPAGAKLRAILHSEIATANERAAMRKGHPFDAGWACGYRGLYAWFESLSAAATTDLSPSTDEHSQHPLDHLLP